MKMIFIRGAGYSFSLSYALLLLAGTIFIAAGCKKMEDTPPIAEETTAAVPKLKQAVDLQILEDGFVSPIGVVPIPDNSGRLIVIDQVGKLWVLDANGNKRAAPFIDLTGRMVTLNPGFDERGLLGVAFHPDYASNGRLFIYYNAPPRAGGPTPVTTWNNLSRFSEFRISADPNVVDMSSERVFLEIDDPQGNHNGGTLIFGNDGYLYISIGDGGGANDANVGHVPDWYLVNAGGNGQDVETNLWGSVLRLDINGAMPYGIPPDNPFVGKPGLDEIYAYGFRNPYRMSFDMGGSRRLFLGDAGQILYEEVDVVEKGGNYGWNVKEGIHCFSTATPGTSLPDCPTVDPLGNRLIDPVIEMLNVANPASGVKTLTVIGGHVYRGNMIHGLKGDYVFGSFSKSSSPQGELFIAKPAGPGLWPFQEITLASFPDHLGAFVKGFGQDLEGEIYVATSTVLGPSGTTGKVYKLVAAE
ncbi:MAG TPA: PQQ-dependent sugar dehydrogenase [Chitinophagaceae bacterium]